jgi:metal-sulfur cluster biosynthetic enzyme
MTLNAEQVREQLRQVYDPELGVNIVDLGLVYDIRVTNEQIYIRMTLTTPGCPMHKMIVGGVERALQEQKENRELEVDVVWEPRWSPEMMSDQAKEQLGYL